MSHKRIAVIGRSGEIDNSFEKSSEQLFRECGLNTGNLAFWYAMSRHIGGDKSYFGWAVDPEYLKANFDAIMFPAANQLNPDWDMGVLADLFEKADLPLIICGLGVQAKDISQKLKFKKGSLRFMKVISERAKKIGVRGEFTADVMSENGVSNLEIIGCPSNFIANEPNLGKLQELQFRNLTEVHNIALNLDITPSHLELMRTAYKWGKTLKNTIYVNQAPEALVKMANGDFSLVEQGTINHIHNILCPEISQEGFKAFVKCHFKVFYSATEWMNQLKTFDLAVGTRMHGNMLAWQAKTPCVLFPHDSRTHELASLMKLPYIMSSDIGNDYTIQQLLNNVTFDGAGYDVRRALLLDRYINLLNESGVQVSESLKSLHSQMNITSQYDAA
ncbi:polysaccharide pyruvyl transferase family protein [Alteromonas stellipolaris]|uniref:polysaccharide pyruvyl transferase family protein n=1 Tax=Alteromonas stellipolaris TaxID=233316 RepID=UPI001DAEFE11|nr:polysaccharide pyruvyl transferase family protein [Alteromonas stellipolaris]MBZ2163625.1 polysaccharide pyruvyl transferase family protein [Alteromonas stellipolaris]